MLLCSMLPCTFFNLFNFFTFFMRMKFLKLIMLQYSTIFSALIIILLGIAPISAYSRNNIINAMKNDSHQVVVSRTVTVDKSGHGNFTTVQQAIDSVPNNNQLWTLIHVKAGIYTEKVTIQQDKQFILLEGEGSHTTVISWEAGGNVVDSSTFTMLADNFVARDIAFKNTYNHVIIKREEVKHTMTWAPAALVAADKVSFYRCGFISLQDTLFDAKGRHYFRSCYIEGAVDFIWGNAQSFFQGCNINVTASQLGQGGVGYITAQGRESDTDSSGFVFHTSSVIGTGPVFLGRAYRNHSRVVYYKTHMDGIVTPQGWDAWFNAGHEDLLTYVEVGCSGAGSDQSNRVKWEKRLPYQELRNLIHVNRFLNHDEWIEKQPSYLGPY